MCILSIGLEKYAGVMSDVDRHSNRIDRLIDRQRGLWRVSVDELEHGGERPLSAFRRDESMAVGVLASFPILYMLQVIP